ncbi:hypothetical protein F4009_13980 [Candidatus Poribacteria bacterium]|nr:hypothetical protein [Candidatus Poribacteria bacterium]MYH80617.1 hypothetical protein [Candidatus Poribacteria bacterium]MYK95083.1 hypothetical protein [Candidatus Poribacteria bacterium]
MSKNNGNGLPPKQKNGKSFERHHFDKPGAMPVRDGISIIAAGAGATPSEIQIIVKVPGAKVAPRLSFRKHAMLTDLIEQLIAYRRLVFPDAPEINTNATLEE